MLVMPVVGVDDGVAAAAGVSARFTGKAATHTRASEAQKRSVSSPASVAPGTTRRMPLSTSSIPAIENVSDASARPSTVSRRAGQAGAAPS